MSPRGCVKSDSVASPRKDGAVSHQGDLDLVLEPHEGVVYLDATPLGQVITNTLTLERKQCPPEDVWELTFVEGYGALAASTSDRVLLLEDWLEFNIYRKGQHLIILSSDRSLATARNLNTWQRSYEEIGVKFTSGATIGEVSLGAYLLQRPRQGSTIYIEA